MHPDDPSGFATDDASCLTRMPASRFTLGLGLVLGCFSPTLLAAENNWQCSANAEGQWQCSGNSSLPSSGNTVSARTTTPTTPASGSAEQLDWVPRSAMSASQLAELPGYCSGAYIEPDYYSADQLSQNPVDQAIYASAQQVNADTLGTNHLVGDVRINQGYRQIVGEEVYYDRETGIARIENEAIFREPGLLLIGSDTQVNLDTKEVQIQNARFVAHDSHMRGEAEQLERTDEGEVEVYRGSLTSCPPGDSSWAIRASEITLNQDTGIGTAM